MGDTAAVIGCQEADLGACGGRLDSEAISQTKDNDLHCNAVQMLETKEGKTERRQLNNDQNTSHPFSHVPYLSVERAGEVRLWGGGDWAIRRVMSRRSE